jgi:hypothetical protein
MTSPAPAAITRVVNLISPSVPTVGLRQGSNETYECNLSIW